MTSKNYKKTEKEQKHIKNMFFLNFSKNIKKHFYIHGLKYLHQFWQYDRYLATRSNFAVNMTFYDIQDGGLAEVCTLWVLASL